jgi:hypothetical protein
MKNNQRTLLVLGAAVLGLAGNASAQIIVNEQFSYADQTALDANWNLGVNNTLTLSPGGGSASIGGAGTNPNIWDGTAPTFSLTPTDANPIRLTADITAPGNVGSVGTVGLRTGANPLFEMGLYRSFDNVQTGPDTSTAGAGTGIGVRTINIGPDLPGQDWVKMGDYFNGTARFEATIGATSVTTRIDLGIDGTWDLSYTEIGTNSIGAFTDLRVHSPVAASPLAAGGITVDNIVLEVVPEPSTYALLGFGSLLVGFAARRKK